MSLPAVVSLPKLVVILGCVLDGDAVPVVSLACEGDWLVDPLVVDP